MSVRLCALERARTHVGVKEQPPGSNRGPLIDQWCRLANGLVGYPWCMAFLHAMFRECGVKLGGYAGVERFEQWAEQNGYIVRRPLRGDLVCYDWDGGGWADHVGIIDRVLALRWRDRVFVGWVRAIEGNTSFGDDSNGGKVMVRTRWIRSARFARIPD